MDSWQRRIATGALLLAAGCTGTISTDSNKGGSGTNTGQNNGPGQGNGPGSGPQSDPTVCIPGIPQTSQLPRLTRAQYDATIRDLVGIDNQPSTMLAPDTPGAVDQRAWDGYQTAAKTVAAQVMADANARAKVIPCTPTGDGSECATQLIQTFGQRAFRRPLTVEEVQRFQKLYTDRASITPTGSFEEAAELIIRAFLLSPSFLTRGEISEQLEGDHIALNGYEIASRLSYMLWGTMPDDDLFAAAAAGQLSTPQQILEQAKRMLQDPKARSMVASFHQKYAHMGDGTRWADFSRDTNLFPLFNSALVPYMSQETERLFDHVVFDLGGTFRDLFTTPIAFVNSALAPLYNLDPSQYGEALTPVTLDANLRPGIFTRVGFLSSYSLFNRSSPILRGAFIQKEILCREIGAPPPDAESTPLPATGSTNRERVDAQTAGAECKACHHSIINPTGFALESFDAIGAYQVTEVDTGAPINTEAAVPIGDEIVDVTGPADLFAAIADSEEAKLCYARKWVQAAYERALTNEDSCTAENLASKLTGNYRVVDLIADLTQAESFRLRAVPSEVAP